MEDDFNNMITQEMNEVEIKLSALVKILKAFNGPQEAGGQKIVVDEKLQTNNQNKITKQ